MLELPNAPSKNETKKSLKKPPTESKDPTHEEFRDTMNSVFLLAESLAKTEKPFDLSSAEIFPSENAEIKLAKGILAKYRPTASFESLCIGQQGTSLLLDEIEAIEFSRRLIEFANSFDPELVRKTFDHLPVSRMKEFITFLAQQPLPEQELQALKKAGSSVFIAKANQLLNLNKLVSPSTAAEKAAAAQALLDAPSEVPSKAVTVYGKEQIIQTEGAMDYDEQDYKLAPELKGRLPEGVSGSISAEFGSAIMKGEIGKAVKGVEEAVGRKLTDNEKKFAEELILGLQDWMEGKKTVSAAADAKTLPASGRTMEVYHAKFNRTRTIDAFPNILLNKMSSSLLTYVIQELPKADTWQMKDLKPVGTKAEKLYQLALQMYKDVHKNGMPAFRDFAEFLEKNAPPSGEFHVGRDTFTTTYTASQANRWGKMSGSERLEAIKHVNVSRTLVDNTPRVILENFLRQEGVNERMMGVDGGYSGTSPEHVLFTLRPGLSHAEASKQIKLIETAKEERRFNLSDTYSGVVAWMEGTPKFTERSQRVEKDAGPYGKYLVATQLRDEAERLLAWTVQHAVWREMIPKQMKSVSEDAELAVETKGGPTPEELAYLKELKQIASEISEGGLFA